MSEKESILDLLRSISFHAKQIRYRKEDVVRIEGAEAILKMTSKIRDKIGD